MNLFVSLLFKDPFAFCSWIIVVVFSICCHECAHAYAALKAGDDTAAKNGHLSLNPMVQMGPTSLVMLVLIGIAWGAVPVDPRNLRSRLGAAVVSLAGPLSNLLLSFIFAGLAQAFLALSPEGPSYAARFFTLGSVANGVLFVLNILPVPMLDGWGVLSSLVTRLQRISAQHFQMIAWIFIMLVFLTPVSDVIWKGGEILNALFHIFWRGIFQLMA